MNPLAETSVREFIGLTLGWFIPCSSAIVISLVLSISDWAWAGLDSGTCLLNTGSVFGFVVEQYSVVVPRCFIGVLSFNV